MKSICLCLLMIMPASMLLAQKNEPDFSQRFVILTHKKISMMEKQLAQAQAAGYKVLCASHTGTAEMSLILEKSQDGTSAEYRLLVDSDMSTVKSRINEAAKEGFRLMPSSLLKRGNVLKNKEFMVVMEKEAGAPKFEYLVLISELNQGMQNVLAKAAGKGFEVLAMMAGNNDDHVVFMQKTAE